MTRHDLPLIRLEKISKSFGSVQANRDITLDIEAGKIRALLGENGAGKSTLMNILAGTLQPDSGKILINGKVARIFSTKNALDAGIGMVYQHFKLVEAMTVAENIFLGQKAGFFLSPVRMAERVSHLGKKYGLEIDPSARVSQLSLGEKQRVEIVKLLHRNSQILILDEPTAVLTPREADQLFSAIRQMAKDGKAIVFISHKLDEVMEIADSISILRKGRVIDEMPIFEVTSKADLARRMVGREILLDVKKNEMEIRQRILRVKGLSSHDLREITFDLRQGEILGIVGVAGNGQKALVEIICGLTPPPSGSVTILGQSWNNFFSGRDDGGALSYIPEDRRGLGACLGLDMVDNFLLTTRKSFSNGPWLTKKRARKKLEDLVEAFKIYPRETSTMAGQLSGGNLQKLVLAREFFRKPRLIVAEQPSQGLDIGATEELWKLLLTARERAGILLVTGDLSEALAMSDRIGVMFSGKMTDVFSVDDADKVDNIAMMMTGVGGPGIGQ